MNQAGLLLLGLGAALLSIPSVLTLVPASVSIGMGYGALTPSASHILIRFTPAAGGAGWAMIAGLVLAVGGFNALATSVLGEYVWRAGDDARQRPSFIVKSITEAGGR